MEHEGDERDEGGGEMGRWGGEQMREKVILLSPISPSPYPPILFPCPMPHALCPMPYVP
ncbi:MAG: hypothetical protein RMY29_008470 [Nostoc sp. CreGUA01]|nr:hypothetical protein [Nostoc sp. CreGUA01]